MSEKVVEEDIAATNVYNFLHKRSKGASFVDIIWRESLEKYIYEQLQAANDADLLNRTISHFGWNFKDNCFDLDVDIAGLQIALSKKNQTNASESCKTW
jgi:hypothetical protein